MNAPARVAVFVAGLVAVFGVAVLGGNGVATDLPGITDLLEG